MEIRKYGGQLVVAELTGQDVLLSDPSRLFSEGVTQIRASVPAADEKARDILLRQGYVFADRMYDVAVCPGRRREGYRKLVRLPVTCSGTAEEREAVRRIAHAGFTRDRRFHVREALDQETANRIMDAWIEECPAFYLCRYGGEVAGFLALRELDGQEASIHLAAVAEAYRPAGAALSLYAFALQECKDAGKRMVRGYVSSGNLPVLNLYGMLGASFIGVSDVFLKERM